MKHTERLPTLRRSAFRHQYEDGITEILIAVLLAVGAFALRHGRAIVVLLLACWLPRLLVRLRDRFTAPRTGSAELAVPAGQLLGGVVFFIGIVATVILVSRLATVNFGIPLKEFRWLPLFTGLSLCGGFYYVISRAALRRFYLYIAASAGAGLYLTLTAATGTRAEGYGNIQTLLLFLSAVVLLGGLASFLLFLHRNPVAPAQPGGELHGC